MKHINEGRDVYVLTLLDVRHKVKKKLDEVFCDELGSTIGHLIERPDGMTDEVYKKVSMADSNKKMSA